MHNMAVLAVTQDAEHAVLCVLTFLCRDDNVTACLTGVAPLSTDGTIVGRKI